MTLASLLAEIYRGSGLLGCDNLHSESSSIRVLSYVYRSMTRAHMIGVI